MNGKGNHQEQTPAKVHIRDAQPDDLEAITRIYGHHVRFGLGTFEEEPPTEREMHRRYQALRDQGLPYLVAASPEGLPLGFAYAGLYRPRPAYRFTLEDSIYVDPEKQGRGLGKHLLRRLIERGTALGYRQMMAVVGDSGNHGSIKLHQSLGFETVGHFKSLGFKLGRWVDVVVLQRGLGDADRGPPL